MIVWPVSNSPKTRKRNEFETCLRRQLSKTVKNVLLYFTSEQNVKYHFQVSIYHEERLCVAAKEREFCQARTKKFPKNDKILKYCESKVFSKLTKIRISTFLPTCVDFFFLLNQIEKC
jgi:hypothetical protein